MADIEAQANNKKTELEATAIFKKANRPVTLKVYTLTSTFPLLNEIMPSKIVICSCISCFLV
jgi:hypothetical protein